MLTIPAEPNGRLERRQRKMEFVPDTAVFRNESDRNCVIVFFNEDTFGKPSIRVPAKRHVELRFLKPVVHTQYMVCEECVATTRDGSKPDDIPGGDA
jgi:hypothetical protein